MTASSQQILGISSHGMLCQSIVFESIEELQAPGLLRTDNEDTMAVSLQDHKIGILVKS